MDLKSYIRLISAAGAKLGEIRDEELRRSSYDPATAEALGEAFRFALKTSSPRPTSGMVEYQAILKRLIRD